MERLLPWKIQVCAQIKPNCDKSTSGYDLRSVGSGCGEWRERGIRHHSLHRHWYWRSCRHNHRSLHNIQIHEPKGYARGREGRPWKSLPPEKYETKEQSIHQANRILFGEEQTRAINRLTWTAWWRAVNPGRRVPNLHDPAGTLNTEGNTDDGCRRRRAPVIHAQIEVGVLRGRCQETSKYQQGKRRRLSEHRINGRMIILN